jgi:hypothetical protein
MAKRKVSPLSDAFEDNASSFSAYEHVPSTSTRKKVVRKNVRKRVRKVYVEGEDSSVLTAVHVPEYPVSRHDI